MILVITTREHRYTHESLHRERALDLDVVTYDEILNRRAPYRATHVFTDLDRLADWQLHEAALFFRRLHAERIPALNDPARFLGRFGMLRSLSRARINAFDAYRAEGHERPRKWPVFLRLEGDHGAPVSGLLHDEEELEAALRQSIDQGAPRSALLIIEYAAEPTSPGLYRKLSVFRVGDKLVGYTCVHDDNWLVKYGKPGIATQDLYEDEYRLVKDNPYAEAVKPAFDLAGIEYGRADFGLVGGRPQIYEINTNPHMTLGPHGHPVPRRSESEALFRTNYLVAMSEIDSFPRPGWRRHSAAFARTVRHSPPRIRGLAGRVVGKMREKIPLLGDPHLAEGSTNVRNIRR